MRWGSHPLTLFSLIPVNKRAKALLHHPDNRHLVSVLPDVEDENGKKGEVHGFNIGFHIGSKSRHTLATLGRSGADVTVDGSDISKIQCSFEFHQDTHEIMLYDRSTAQSTQTYGENATLFERTRTPRRVVVREKVNDAFRLGGGQCDVVQFAIHWHKFTFDKEEQINNRDDNPRFAQTEDGTETIIPSRRVTRFNTLVDAGLKIRYAKISLLGSGQFGEVMKVVNADSGEYLAVKKIKWSARDPQSRNYTLLKREVETLACISHVS